ncbi:hypothetical protein BHE18_13385 [Rossellomorea aquimaris]|uniref:Uncharacterized protein n=1 Tax=Rossellomorea aquimaris TaxID=189382 RepID=A0A1J6WF43_9BACI|nr:hypothetical protein BHE18_13385 [Rossellomorea aquimaris]
MEWAVSSIPAVAASELQILRGSGPGLDGLGQDPAVKVFRQVARILVKVDRKFQMWIVFLKSGS